ncbi:MAG: hypothetical protein ACRDQZ_25510 [Mycobacteriales bacterium]
MQSPSAMFIESAADRLREPGGISWLRGSQQKELTSFGDARARELGASGVSDDFRKGYELGLETARVVIRGSMALNLKSVNPDDVL